MHIRTVGELHDTINAQANEIEALKKGLEKALKSVCRLKTLNSEIIPIARERRVQLIREIISWSNGDKARTLKSISVEYFISYHIAKRILKKHKKAANN